MYYIYFFNFHLQIFPSKAFSIVALLGFESFNNKPYMFMTNPKELFNLFLINSKTYILASIIYQVYKILLSVIIINQIRLLIRLNSYFQFAYHIDFRYYHEVFFEFHGNRSDSISLLLLRLL